MSALRTKILACLETYGDADNRLVAALEDIVRENGDHSYAAVFEIITHLRLENERAKYLWYGLLDHRQEMMRSLDRPVGLRTSLCDYFCSVSNTLENPMVVELHVFENHYRSHVYDHLTGLYSRGLLDTTLNRELARSRRHRTELSILFFDIDNFKSVNDTYGHPAGDECLAGVAGLIRNEIRTEDSAIRYGGEEILIVFPRTDKLQALTIGERLRRLVSDARFAARETAFSVTMSGGLVSFPMDGDDSETLLRHADQAMYKAKSAGKNNIVVYSSEKRRYIRVDFDSRIVVRHIGFHDDPDAFFVRGRNISAGGILFETDVCFEIGAKLQLSIQFGRRNAEAKLTGAVVRSERNPGGGYDTGLAFLRMDRPAKNEISAYLESRLEQLEVV